MPDIMIFRYMLALTIRRRDKEPCRTTIPRSQHTSRHGGLHLFAAGLLLLAASLGAGRAHAEDGYRLWLRYHALPAAVAGTYRSAATQLVAGKATPTQAATRHELLRGLQGLLGKAPPLSHDVTRDGAIVIGTPSSSPLIASLHLDIGHLGDEGYLIKRLRVNGHVATVI